MTSSFVKESVFADSQVSRLFFSGSQNVLTQIHMQCQWSMSMSMSMVYGFIWLSQQAEAS